MLSTSNALNVNEAFFQNRCPEALLAFNNTPSISQEDFFRTLGSYIYTFNILHYNNDLRIGTAYRLPFQEKN